MHDRRIDGKPTTFGNAGALFRGAMTWYDHETGSIWSQPWGRAIIGERKGVQLRLIPSEVTTWGTWRSEYPHTLALANDADILATVPREIHSDEFVIGVSIDQHAISFDYAVAEEAGVINTTLGPYPILVVVNQAQIHVFHRELDAEVLTFRRKGADLLDTHTSTIWDEVTGLGKTGVHAGKRLIPIPWISAYKSAWEIFYPESRSYHD